MSDFGKCFYCDLDGVMSVNGKSACMEHIDTAMGDAFSPVQRLLKGLPS